jgi:hypothetical protein
MAIRLVSHFYHLRPEGNWQGDAFFGVFYMEDIERPTVYDFRRDGILAISTQTKGGNLVVNYYEIEEVYQRVFGNG